MLRKLSNINSISVIQQNLGHNIYGLSEIQYEETVVGKGAVGSVFKVINVDGRSETGLLLKLISEPEFSDKSLQTITILHEKLNEYQANTGIPVLVEMPELSGLPFIAFKATLENSEDEISGYLMRDLGYYGFSDLGSESWNREKYITNTGFEEKLYLCYQFAKGINFLHDLKFIHADLKENSIFLNLDKPQLSIIDFDGGYHYDKQPFALTIGALTSWASPFWRKIIGQGKSSKDVTTSERLSEENWILASGLFEILFGIQPFYFLKNIDEVTIDSYLKKSRWPEILNDSTELNQQNIPFHNSLLKIIENLSDQGLKPLIDAFKKIFNDGHLKESKRLNPKQWLALLKEINKEFIGEPKINKFKTSTQIINAKDEKVKFSWDAHFYNAIYLDDKLQDPLINEASLNIEDEKEIEIRVLNDFGFATEIIKIKANKVIPLIHEFSSNIQKRVDLAPVMLSWSTSNCKNVTIQSLEDDLVPIGNIEVNPLSKTKYVLTAIGFFDQKNIAELEVDVETAKITSFRYEINIERGINNVDLFWTTEHATEAEINPRIGKIELSGRTHIGIHDKMDFTLIARGHFNEVQSTIEAQPFPIPIIQGIFIPTPSFSLEARIPDNYLEIPSALTKALIINFNNNISFEEVIPPYVRLNSEQVLKNIEETSKNVFLTKFDNIYKQVFKKINTK
jgi:serine/threonine protein kinase